MHGRRAPGAYGLRLRDVRAGAGDPGAAPPAALLTGGRLATEGPPPRPEAGPHALALVRRLVIDERRALSRTALFGRWWAVATPLLEGGAFTLVFGVLLGLGGGAGEYLPFVFIGTTAWRAFARAAGRAARAIPGHRPLLLHLPVAPSIVVTAAMGSALVDALIGVPILVGVVVLTSGAPAIADLAWLAPGLLLQLVFLAGFGWIAAVAHTFYRDVGAGLGPLLGILMFATPVVYDATFVPEPWRALFLANPMAGAIECYRAALLGASPPPAASLAAGFIVSAMVCALGAFLLRTMAPRLREVL